MTTTGDDRAFALRGLIAAMLAAQRLQVDRGPAAARRAAEIRLDLLVELISWSDRWIPEEEREPDPADHPTPAEVEKANDAIEMVIAGLATLGKDVRSGGRAGDRAREPRPSWRDRPVIDRRCR